MDSDFQEVPPLSSASLIAKKIEVQDVAFILVASYAWAKVVAWTLEEDPTQEEVV